MDLHIVVLLVLPVFEEDGADGAVHAASKEGENGATGDGYASDEAVGEAGLEIDFWKGDVFEGFEAFGSVGVAEDSDGVGVEVRGSLGSKWPPIMTREHEMICTEASIPIRIS